MNILLLGFARFLDKAMNYPDQPILQFNELKNLLHRKLLAPAPSNSASLSADLNKSDKILERTLLG